MAIKKSELYSTLAKCTNKIRSNCGLNAEMFKNYVLIMLFLKYISDRKRSNELELIEIPEGCTFQDIVNLKNTTNIGDGINKIIGKIKEANDGVLDFINIHQHDFCDKSFGSPKEASSVISELVSAFQHEGLDFTRNRAADDDLMGDAYEYLMRNFASQSGKDKGQFYTPTEVSRLMAILIGIDKDNRSNVSVYDPTCGSGSLLLRTRAAANSGMQVSLQGQELDHSNVEMCNLNMIIHGYEEADIRQGDTLNNPQHYHDGNRLDQFDYIVSNPPFSLHNWMSTAKEDDEYGRWNHEIGVPPQQYGDFAFLMHVVKSLKHDGRAAIILPNGVLTRGNDEERLRTWLVDQQLISGIVALPPNTFYGTGIAGNIIVIDKNRSRDGIFFIDASKGFYKDDDSKNRLREQDIKRITDAWSKREDVPHFAKLVPYDKIQNYNLNIPRYVEQVNNEIEHNIEAHLKGGIPSADVQRFDYLWEICPSLKKTLLKRSRPGFWKMIPSENEIAETISNDQAFIEQHEVFKEALENWIFQITPKMLDFDRGGSPKEVIAVWSQLLLLHLRHGGFLLDKYEAYDQLMNYWAETMQDDLYLVSRGGWNPELVTPVKKTFKWSDLTCDLLPVDLMVEKFLSDKWLEYLNTETQIAELTAELKETEENEDGEEVLKISDSKERKSKEKKLKALKALLKAQNGEMVKAIADLYHSLDTQKVCHLVVEDKWLPEIRIREEGAMETVSETLASSLRELHNRYARTLSEIDAEVSAKESEVAKYLNLMGYKL